MKLLMDHDWPGNVRELENAVERAVILASGSSIGPETLPEQVFEDRTAASGSPLGDRRASVV